MSTKNQHRPIVKPFSGTPAKPDATSAAISNPEKDKVFSWVRCNYDTISNCVSVIYGPEGWFKAFLQSDEFAELSKEEKAEAFTMYKDLTFMLRSIDDVCRELKVGEYA